MSKLHPAQIVDEALSIMTADGEAALAMRPLAARLGVTPMALYRYFADRDALLVALVERVSQNITLPEPRPEPVDSAVELALCLHDFLTEYPWLIRLISTGRLASPAGMQFPEGFLACAAQAGLDDAQAFVFYRTMFATILGQATMSHAQAETSEIRIPDLTVGPPVPAVSALAPRWSELAATASPRAVFQAVAAALAAPETPPRSAH